MIKFFLIIVCVIFLFGFIIVRILGFLTSLFGFGKKQKEENKTTYSSKESTAEKKTKIFSKSDGEYVDYEEVK